MLCCGCGITLACLYRPAHQSDTKVAGPRCEVISHIIHYPKRFYSRKLVIRKMVAEQINFQSIKFFQKQQQ